MLKKKLGFHQSTILATSLHIVQINNKIGTSFQICAKVRAALREMKASFQNQRRFHCYDFVIIPFVIHLKVLFHEGKIYVDHELKFRYLVNSS